MSIASHVSLTSSVLYTLLILYIFHRSHDATSVAQLPLKARELMRNVHKRVFMTYLRMATHKESNVRRNY